MKGVTWMNTPRFVRKELNRNDYKTMEIGATALRVLLTPVFIFVRLYCWIWDYDYYERFKH